MTFRYSFIFFSIIGLIKAQNLLTIQDAIKTGLEKQYGVLMLRNNDEISKLRNNAGNAGLSPTVTLNANLNFSKLDSRQEFATGGVQDREGATSNSTGASINASWMIFDGLRMFAVKKRLELNQDLSAIQLKAQMENTVFEVIAEYYNIVRIRELIKAASHNIKIVAERKKIAALKFEIGSDSKVDVLLTRSEENKIKSELMQMELDLLEAKIKLNNLLSRSGDVDFITEDSIIVNYNPSLEDLRKGYAENNSGILASKKEEVIFQQVIRETKASSLPFIQINGNYLFTNSRNQAGFILLNRQNGLSGGLSAGWTIFNGNKNNKLIKERQILYLNQRYATEQIQLEVDALVFMNYKAFMLSREIASLEKLNMADASEVLEISMERYRIGKTNLLETIETQKNLTEVQTRYIKALYSMKLAEAKLLKAIGELVK